MGKLLPPCRANAIYFTSTAGGSRGSFNKNAPDAQMN
jgi:hypothetical protein